MTDKHNNNAPAVPFCYASVNKQGDVTSTHKRKDSWRTVPLYLTTPAPAVPQTVYLVENRTCLLAYASREDADKAVASMPASVGGGFLVSPVQVFGAPAPAPAVPQGWAFSVSDDDDGTWLRVKSPGGREAAFSAVNGGLAHDNRRSIASRVLLELKEALAATPAPVPAQEPETALQKFTRFKVAETEGNPVEMLRAFCAFAMNSQDWFDVEPFFDLVREAMASRTAVAPAQEVERERDYYKSRAHTMFEHQEGEVWYWQGGGEDHPETLVNSLPVVIRADQLRELIAKPTREVGLTDDEIDENTVWLDQDPLDTVRHCDVSATVHKCVAALRAKGGK